MLRKCAVSQQMSETCLSFQKPAPIPSFRLSSPSQVLSSLWKLLVVAFLLGGKPNTGRCLTHPSLLHLPLAVVGVNTGSVNLPLFILWPCQPLPQASLLEPSIQLFPFQPPVPLDTPWLSLGNLTSPLKPLFLSYAPPTCFFSISPIPWP